MPESVKVFLSTVSDEFRAYRDQLRTDLTRHNVEVKVQEDFKDLGGGILDKLDVYIAHCDCVMHLVGDMTGSAPLKRDVDALLAKYPDLVVDFPPLGEALRDGVDVSYTQWEAWLALYHRKPLLIAKAADKAERGSETMRRRTPRARRRSCIWRGSRQWDVTPAARSPAQTISPNISPTTQFLICWPKRAPNERRTARKTSPSRRSVRSSRAANKTLISCTRP